MNYKAPDNSLHVIDPEYAHLLPAGCVPIAPEEADALRPVPPPPTTQELLAKLDADNTLTQRNLRETVMLMSAAISQISGGAIDLSNDPVIAKAYVVEAQAVSLRSKLKVL